MSQDLPAHQVQANHLNAQAANQSRPFTKLFCQKARDLKVHVLAFGTHVQPSFQPTSAPQSITADVHHFKPIDQTPPHFPSQSAQSAHVTIRFGICFIWSLIIHGKQLTVGLLLVVLDVMMMMMMMSN